MRDDSITAGTTTMSGHDGDEITAYLARPAEPTPRGGVVVIHHMPGWDASSKEIVRRFATLGYDAVMPNLHHRAAPGADSDDAAAASRAAGGVPDEQLVGDVTAAAQLLRGLDSSNGRVGAIGYCSGGRQAVLAGCRTPIDATVDCYGAFVVGTPPPDFPLQVSPLYDVLGDLACPLLGLFGNDDSYPTPEQVDELDRLLDEHGKPHDLVRYDGAGHAFFAVDRPSYRPAAATDGWQRVADFFSQHLSA